MVVLETYERRKARPGKIREHCSKGGNHSLQDTPPGSEKKGKKKGQIISTSPHFAAVTAPASHEAVMSPPKVLELSALETVSSVWKDTTPALPQLLSYHLEAVILHPKNPQKKGKLD